MDRNLQRTSLWWIFVLISVSALSDSRLVHSRGPGAAPPRGSGRTRGDPQPPAPAVEQRPNARLGARPRPVVVHCRPDSVEVVVQADMFDTGLQVDGRHLRLGADSAREGSACGAVPSGEAEFTVRAQLMDCGTKLSSTAEKIIYSNVLVYSPEPSSDGLLRLDGATIPVECHYEKRYAVDGVSLNPDWVSSVSIVSAEDRIDFNLLLMTDDWQFERGSSSYFLGDPIRFEVSAILGNHTPLRVYVDRCVATATPDAEATLRYDFIEHHGCLVDAYLTNSRSHFLPRVEQHKLRFELEAFRFYQEPSNEVYIACYLKAVPVMSAVSPQNRACSLVDNRWRSVDGNDQACGSCDRSHRSEVSTEPPTEPPTATVSSNAWHPTPPQESSVQSTPPQQHHHHHQQQQQQPASYFRVRPGARLNQQPPHLSSSRLMKRGAGHKAEQTVQLGPIVVVARPSNKTRTRPMDSKTALSS